MPYMPDPDRYLCKDIRKTAPPFGPLPRLFLLQFKR